MKLRLILLPLLFCSTISASAAEKKQKVPKQIQQLLAMTPADFAAEITIKDDSLETSAEISTVNGWQQKDGLLKIVNSDQFFRVFVDKKTGKTTFQVYQFVNYYGDWAFFNLVNYETPNGPEQKELDIVSRDVGSCSAYLGCLHSEHVAFNVDEALLRVAASHYKPGVMEAWRYRLKAKSGVQRDEAFVAAEIVALLDVVDRYKASRGLVGNDPPVSDKSAQ